jgi:hypothetical protein
MGIKYKDVIPWGRSFEEYIDMFLLSQADLGRNIVGVGDGPASFNARMFRHGKKIISVDPIYQFTEHQIRQRIEDTYSIVISQTRKNQDKFIWNKYGSLEELGRIRMLAMEEFCSDFVKGKKEGRYINASLPLLPFPDRAFDLVLSSHLLFFYSENRDMDFHLKSVKELLRIGKEVRIFPLVDLNSNPSPYLDAVTDRLRSLGYQYSIEKVQYHFQKDGNEMLRILRPA